MDMDAVVDESKSLNQGALLPKDYAVDSWYWEIYRNSGLFDMDKPISKFTAEEREKWWIDPDAAVGAELAAAVNVSAQLAMHQAHRGTVVVVLERGLSAIIARSFIAAASLISSSNMLVVKTLEEAAEKVRGLPGQPADVANDLQLAEKLEAFLKR